MFKIALVGNTNGINNHSSTFKKGVDYCEKFLKTNKLNDKIYIEVFNDSACYQGGREVSKIIVSKKFDIVIGHFASDSICGAYSLYEKHSVDVLLPAATYFNIACLKHVFRICPNKDKLNYELYNFFFERNINLDLNKDIVNTQLMLDNYLLYSGRIEVLDNFLNSINDISKFNNLIVFDDCIHKNLVNYKYFFQEIFYSSFIYKNKQIDPFPTYYYEFISGFEIAVSVFLNNSKIKNNILYDTTNLDVKFINNENIFSDYAIKKFKGF